jgi:hypothetical protein
LCRSCIFYHAFALNTISKKFTPFVSGYQWEKGVFAVVERATDTKLTKRKFKEKKFSVFRHALESRGRWREIHEPKGHQGPSQHFYVWG